MKNFKHIILLSSCVLGLTACEGSKPTKVNAMQNRDKVLSCDDIKLEINESEFYRKEAEKSRGLGVKTVLMPLGYIDTYMNAGDAVEAADARIDYLNRIYDIRKCDDAANAQASQPKAQQPQLYTIQQPQMVYQPAPVQQYGSPSVIQAAPGY